MKQRKTKGPYSLDSRDRLAPNRETIAEVTAHKARRIFLQSKRNRTKFIYDFIKCAADNGLIQYSFDAYLISTEHQQILKDLGFWVYDSGDTILVDWSGEIYD